MISPLPLLALLLPRTTHPHTHAHTHMFGAAIMISASLRLLKWVLHFEDSPCWFFFDRRPTGNNTYCGLSHVKWCFPLVPPMNQQSFVDRFGDVVVFPDLTTSCFSRLECSLLYRRRLAQVRVAYDVLCWYRAQLRRVGHCSLGPPFMFQTTRQP